LPSQENPPELHGHQLFDREKGEKGRELAAESQGRMAELVDEDGAGGGSFDILKRKGEKGKKEKKIVSSKKKRG